jgi:SAM-dependent methyltransferase
VNQRDKKVIEFSSAKLDSHRVSGHSGQLETPDIESSSSDYATRFAGSIGQWFLEVQARGLRQALAGHPIKNVLDVGGGHGQNLPTLKALGHNIEILGSGKSCPEPIAGELAQGCITYKPGNLLELPYPDNSFDAAISFRMLAHLQDWQRHIAELCRISRGLVIVDFPVSHSVNALAERMFFLKQAIETNTRKYQLFRAADINAIFAEQGFVQTLRYPQYFFPMALYRGLKHRGLARLMEQLARSTGLSSAYGSPIIASFSAASLAHNNCHY